MPFTHVYPHRVRYRECDPMGVVYHTHYIDYFEAARTEALREAGLAYKRLEDAGVIMPVVELSVRYRRPAHYDDLLLIESRIDELAGSRIHIDYRIARAPEEATAASVARLDALPGEARPLVVGRVTLCFVDAARGRPVEPPELVRDVLAPFL
jgi:acyl-CoA thioester hydrolase